MPRSILHAILVAIAALALGVPVLVVAFGPRVVARRHVPVAPPRRIVPAAELPPVEPIKLQDLSPDDARAFNAEVPFSDAPNPAARPFRLAGSDDDLNRATDCLAAAAYYEAGEDPPGQRAVVQVVLNRVRHPAFPKTVCGVVFQGSERATGCQFTFTCDGSLARYTPTADGWTRARKVAAGALAGVVYRPVGYATHYHTEWVVPYWQASLDKIVAVHTQLFYRWTGWWGTPPAFDRHPEPAEPAVPALAALSPAHAAVAAPMVAGAPTPVDPLAALAPASWAPKPLAADPNSFLVTLPPKFAPDLYPALAAKACGDRAVCKFGGWSDAKKTPTRLPVEPSELASMSFSYLRDRGSGFERTLWNCVQGKRPNPAQCMKVQVYQPAPVAPIAPAPLPTPTASSSPQLLDLRGVRRKDEAKGGNVPVAKPGAAPSPRPSPTATAKAAGTIN